MIVWALRRFLERQTQQVLDSMMRPQQAQLETFTRLQSVLRGGDTARQSGFDACRTLEDCRRLPVSDAASMQPVLKSLFDGDAAQRVALGRSRVRGFARTSGTRGDPKIIPLNDAYLASLDRTLTRMVSCHVCALGDWSNLLSGRHVLLGSRPLSGTSPMGLPIFDVSGLCVTRSWWSLRWLYVPRNADLWLDDWPRKCERTLTQSRSKKVMSITSIPALAIDFARRAKETFGVKHLDELWPHLGSLVYGGVHLSAEQKAELCSSWFSPGHAFSFFETYFATEAPLGFSFDARDDALALNSLENLYLFRANPDDADFLFAHELEAGKRYSVYITTPGGLINYHMGDRLEVVSTAPLRVRVAGREGEELSMTGEKITIAQIDLALSAAGLGPARLGTHLPVVWKVPGDRPYLVWGLPHGTVELAADTGCAQRLDEALCSVNVIYAEALRHEGVIEGSRVELIPSGVFESHRQARLGTGVFKPKRLFESRTAFAQAYGWVT